MTNVPRDPGQTDMKSQSHILINSKLRALCQFMMYNPWTGRPEPIFFKFFFKKFLITCSVTRSGDLLDFGQLLNAFGNT